MTGATDGELGDDGATGHSDGVLVKCTADAVAHDLDVDWTRGAIFEFADVAAAERWLATQNGHVHGTLFLASVPEGAETLPVDYYVKYAAGDA